jgi:hypothetical protein
MLVDGCNYSVRAAGLSTKNQGLIHKLHQFPSANAADQPETVQNEESLRFDIEFFDRHVQAAIIAHRSNQYTH